MKLQKIGSGILAFSFVLLLGAVGFSTQAQDYRYERDRYEQEQRRRQRQSERQQRREQRRASSIASGQAPPSCMISERCTRHAPVNVALPALQSSFDATVESALSR